MDHLAFVRAKVLDKHSLYKRVKVWRFKKAEIAFTNGCFDLLHQGHIQTLASAANFADKLIVGLNSDESVRALKGPGRPFQSAMDRAIMIAAFQFVDAVVIFENDTPAELIEFLVPDVLVKGGDYKADEVVGADTVIKAGGKVEIVPFLKDRSSSSLADRIRQS